jgi:hypothetical protein
MAFYGPQREPAARVLRLLRVAMARGGYGFSVGFPVTLRAEYASRAMRAGFAVVEVQEVGRVSRRCAERRVVSVWIPADAYPGVSFPGS